VIVFRRPPLILSPTRLDGIAAREVFTHGPLRWVLVACFGNVRRFDPDALGETLTTITSLACSRSARGHQTHRIYLPLLQIWA
jgi:hypothetical protein